MIVVQGTIPLKPELRTDALQAAQEMMEASQAEPGCITYEFYVGLTDPNVLMLFQEWDTVSALQDHYRCGHTESFLRKLVDFLDGEIATRRYTVVQNDNGDSLATDDQSEKRTGEWDDDDRNSTSSDDHSPRIIH